MDAKDVRGVGPAQPRSDLQSIDERQVILAELHAPLSLS